MKNERALSDEQVARMVATLTRIRQGLAALPSDRLPEPSHFFAGARS